MQLNDKSLLQIFRHFVPVKIFRNPGAMKFNAIVALLLVMAVAPAYAAPVGYSVVTLSSSGCGSSSLTSSATYNVSIYGANFPEPPIQSLFAYTQTGSTDTTGELTSCWDQTSVACYPDTTVCASCPTMKGNSSATSNIATGLLHTSSYGFAHYGQGISDATMSDTLHFTIAGATGTTVTPITVKWKLNADWGTGDPNVESGWVVQCKAWFTFGGTANIDISGSFG
ncbi:MAG: hypothetical protein HXX11_23920, partial [Desulfuromonadales bacterium]|nr:hypothetical protein [Desulfuromonadales bacterium]